MALQLPDFATIEQLDEYRDAGIAEMQRDGHSQNYLIWQEALRRGIDQQLPSLRDMQGLPASQQQVFQETVNAAKSSRQLFDPERMDERLVDMEFDGIPVEDWDAHELLGKLHGHMAEEGDSEIRSELMELISAVENSPHSSMGASIEINMPDPLQTYHVASEQEETGDWYTDARNAAMRPPVGLEGLAIGDGF